MRASEKTRRLTGLALMTAIIVVLQVVASFVKFGPFTIHDKRMNDCLPPILFSAIFKLLKVLPDTELDAC